MFGRFSLVVDVYRQADPRNTWGNAAKAGDDTDGAKVAAILAGRNKVWTIEEAVIGPSSSREMSTAAEQAPMVEAKFIMYTPVEEDIQKNDYVAYYTPDDKLRVLRVSGTAELDYFSPYTGLSVKETYLDVVKERYGR